MGLLLGVAADFALRQRLLQLINLSFGEGVVVDERQLLQLREFLQPLYRSQLIFAEEQYLQLRKLLQPLRQLGQFIVEEIH